MPVRYLHRVTAKNFRSLREIDVELQPLSVLVGPNGAGKTNLLSVVRFLGDTARLDLEGALAVAGGFERLWFRGATEKRPSFQIGIEAVASTHAHLGALDVYSLAVERVGRVTRASQLQEPSNARPRLLLSRSESFRFKRTPGAGRRLTVKGKAFTVTDDGRSPGAQRTGSLANTSTALSTLPRLGEASVGEAIGSLARLLTSFRVFDVDVAEARRPGRRSADDTRLADDASNLAAFLAYLHREHAETVGALEQDLRYVVPGFDRLLFEPVGGSAEAVEVRFSETGLPGSTPLADASFGTVRALALLAMLHDPDPPHLTCVEEVDHGLHPHAIERIVDRMRDATERTQLLIATHSPTFVNRLRADELIVCERDLDNGASRIPAIASEDVAAMVDASDLGPGELWFTGALGGALP